VRCYAAQGEVSTNSRLALKEPLPAMICIVVCVRRFGSGRTIQPQLGFATTGSLGKYPQGVAGLGTTLLFKLGNPIGYVLYHIACGLARRGGFFDDGRAVLLALFYYSDCFLF
jgi:hypothetical protein